MTILLELSIYPLAAGESLSGFIARCVEVIERSGLKYQLGPMGTTIQGTSMAELFGVVAQCIEVVRRDCPRVVANIKLDVREGPAASIDERVEHVRRKVAKG